MDHFSYIDTEIEQLLKMGRLYGVDLYVKRDDLFSDAGGGNKARKLQYILKKAQDEGHNAVVTAGDINSNHNRATALMCAKLGFKVTLVVHNDYPENERFSPNMFICRLTGADIEYCSKSNVAYAMDKAVNDLKTQGYNPYYIWGGGHCLEGSYAYYDAVKHLKEDDIFDYVIVASGTGTTQAGLHAGFHSYFPDTKVIGISVSRYNKRGANEVLKSINELEVFLGRDSYSKINDIVFLDDFLLGGYESTSLEELVLISEVAQKEGLLLDPTYSGKAFFGMKRLIDNGYIKRGSRVLFWNTGGIYNLIGHNFKELSYSVKNNK